MNSKQAKALTDKFFNGGTSAKEEAALYEYYSSEDVDKELLPLRRMFLDYAALQAEGVVAAFHQPGGGCLCEIQSLQHSRHRVRPALPCRQLRCNAVVEGRALF